MFGKPYTVKFNLFGNGQGVSKNEMLKLELAFFPLLLFHEPVIASVSMKEYFKNILSILTIIFSNKSH
jgi:hypothetical protein